MTQENKISEEIVLGGGCFWCVEAIFSRLKGVNKVTPGYAGGITVAPSYEQVCADRTGHAEVIKVEYDPKVISLNDLLEIFFVAHNPTTPGRQGDDVGEQYRSIILYKNDEQKDVAEQFIKKTTEEKIFEKPIVTQVKLLTAFYEAEEYHQDYYSRNPSQPYCRMVIEPKLAKFRDKFVNLMKVE